MARKKSSLATCPASGRDNVLRACVALFVCPDGAAAKNLKEVFENVACDWRVIETTDGAQAARHIMNNGMPNLTLISAQLSKISAPDLIEWIRSFQSAPPPTLVVYGQPTTLEDRERFLYHEVTLILDSDSSQAALANHLSRLVSCIEKRRLQPMENFLTFLNCSEPSRARQA